MSRKSDHPPFALPTELPSPWRLTLRANWAIPLVILALWPVGHVLRDQIDPYFVRIVMLIGINVILAVSLQLINGIAGQFSLGHAGFMAVGAYLAAYPTKTVSAGLTDPAGILLYYLSLAVVVGIGGGLLAVLLVALRRSARWHASLPGVLLLALAAWFLVDVAVAARTAGEPPAYLVWSKTVDILTRLFALLTEWSRAASPAISAFVPGAAREPLCFLLALVGGGLCAAVAGLAIGLPTLRLRGDYLAIATLGFAEIIRVVIINAPALGGATGMTAIPRLTDFVWLYGAVVVTIVVVWRIGHSSTGRALAAVRENEIAASAVGVNPTRAKVLAFVVGAFFAGVAGGLFAHYNSYLNPLEFGFLRSVEIVVMVTLGGLGSISGAIVTAVILTWLPEQLREFSEWRMILYSLLLIVMMLLRPQGLLGSRELWPRRKRSLPADDAFEQPNSPTTHP